MSNETYYRVLNLDSRISNPDQSLTDDIQKFCSDLAHLYSHLSKPMLDVVLMATQLVMLAKQRQDGGGVSLLPALGGIGMCALTGVILKKATPPFGKLIAEQAKRQGELRAAHSRVIQSSEEIAFYGGEKLELNILQESYIHLISHINTIYKTRISHTMLEQFLMRYVWSAIGLSMIALPAFAKQRNQQHTLSQSQQRQVAGTVTDKQADINPAVMSSDDTVSNRTQDFVTARGLLLNAADAIERMMSSWKDVSELAGRTERIYMMIEVFNDVKHGKYKKSQTSNSSDIIEIDIEDDAVDDDIKMASARSLQHLNDNESRGLDGIQRQSSHVTLHKPRSQNRMNNNSDDSSKKDKPKKRVRFGNGEVIDGCDYIDCIDVPIVTPNGDVLIDALTFRMDRTQHLLITGPNGCGKSSLFRLLGGLWPVLGGTLHKPAKKDIFYIPQKPYLTNANLREQFIYPYSEEEYKQAGYTDDDLYTVIDIVSLRNVVEREGGLDSIADWRDVLSGGEKQRVAMARLFVHKPKFAILDECTSAVSIDVEGKMYTAAKNSGITLMTVTHRPTLWKYHTHLLQFTGTGEYVFKELNSGERLSLKEEKMKLEEQLGNIQNTQKRLAELVELLGEDSIYVNKDNNNDVNKQINDIKQTNNNKDNTQQSKINSKQQAHDSL